MVATRKNEIANPIPGKRTQSSQRAQALLPTMLRLLLPLLGAASAAEPKAECNWVNDTDYFGPALGALRSALPAVARGGGRGWGATLRAAAATLRCCLLPLTRRWRAQATSA